MVRVLYFDGRWSGNNGIGRFSRELSQISSSQQVRFLTGPHPTRLKELFKPIFQTKRSGVYFSPGYAARPFLKSQIITIHDLILLERNIGSFYHRAYFNHFLRPRIKQKRIRVVTVSHFSKSRIAAWSGISADDIEVIPNGISEAILKAGETLESTPRGKSVMFVGNVKPHKRFDLFVDAVNMLQEPYSITLVGADLEVRHISERHKVVLLQNVSDDELADAYLKTNVVVVTSLYEGFCMPVLEGAYLGCKIVHLGVLPTVEEIIGNASFSTLGSVNAKALSGEIENATQSLSKLSESERKLLANKYNWDSSREILRTLCQLPWDDLGNKERYRK